MRVGIDFGTTHTVVAVVDRGNYPVVSFDGVDAWPSIVAANAAGELRFGVDAAAVRHEPGWSVLRSIKRLLNEAGPQTEINLAGRNYRLAELLTGFLAQLKSELQNRSNACLGPGETIEAAISVPANASSAQRLLNPGCLRSGRFPRCRAAQRAVCREPRICPSATAPPSPPNAGTS
jgi:molecular chaperone DnaK